MARAPVRAVFAAALVPFLAACPAELVGTVGLTVDQHGDPVLAISWCKGPPPRIAVERAVEAADHERHTDWEQIAWFETDEPPDGRLVLVALADPGPAWTADPALPDLEADVEYTVGVWSGAATQTLGHVRFDAVTIEEMEPGVIIAHDFRGDAEAFEAMARDRC